MILNKIMNILNYIKNLFSKPNAINKDYTMEDKIELLGEINKSFQNIIKNHPDTKKAERELANLNEFNDFRNSLIEESDRGSVLMSAAFIEDKINQLIASYMVDNVKIQKKIFEGNGALATFSSKIDLAFLLGLIPKNIYNDLGILRRMRNDFAHNAKSITFETDYIKNRCNSLQIVVKGALRDDTRAYFLRSMTTILTCINIKMDSFVQCQEQESFDLSIIENPMKMVDDILKQ